MQESSKTPATGKLFAIEFLVGQHSLFFGALGQAFFYVHQFKPYFPVWVAGPFFLIPWAAVFLLFFANRLLFPPRQTRRYWLYAVLWYTFLTVMAEIIWLGGYMPALMPKPPVTPLVSLLIIQIPMNLGWLSFIPIIHDYIRNPHLWQ